MNQNFNPTGFLRKCGVPCIFALCLGGLVAGVGVPAVAQSSDDPDFVAAMTLIEQGKWAEAEALLSAQLSQNPGLHRARIELALVYLQLEQPLLAEYHFDQILAVDKIPPNVRENIEHMRSQIVHPPALQSEGEHQFDGYVELGVGHDDNVRFSSDDYFLDEDPYRDGIFVEFEDGELIYLSPQGLAFDVNGNRLTEYDGIFDLGNPDSDNAFVEAKLAFGHQVNLSANSGLTWHNDVSIQATENDTFDQYDKLQVRLETGLSWHWSERWSSSATLHHRVLKRDNQTQVEATTAEADLGYFSEYGRWTLGFEWMQRDYEDSLFVSGDFETLFYGFDTTTRNLSAKWTRLFLNDDLLLLAKLEYMDSNSSDGFDYKGRRVTLASVWKLNEKADLSLSATDFNQDYSEIGDGKLEDQTRSLRAKLSYSLTEHVALFLSYERALRSSDIYGGIDSDKSATQLGIKLTF